MGSVLESSYIRRRLQEMDQMYPEPSTFGSCDCTSYSYFALSAAMFSVGTYITVLALGDIRGYLFSSLGHMWLVGPIFICSGLMVAVKSVLYLRRKSVIQMLLRQRVLLRVRIYLFVYFFLLFAIVRLIFYNFLFVDSMFSSFENSNEIAAFYYHLKLF